MSNEAPNYVTCSCQHCDGNIEFDSNRLTAENKVVPCPHCGSVTTLSIVGHQESQLSAGLPEATTTEEKDRGKLLGSCQSPNDASKPISGSKATNYQKAILRSLKIWDEEFLALLGECRASQLIENSKLIKELLLQLHRDGLVRERISAKIRQSLFSLDVSALATPTLFLAHIRANFPELLLSEGYGKASRREHRTWRQQRQEGEFAPAIEILQMPSREPGEPDATPAQKRFLRDLGVRDEQILAGLGKSVASVLIEKVLEERDQRFSSGNS